ncbi:MAG: HD domain-containing protein [Deltaproteobacteria bacterium]|nr:HD domain-containing protein [Deltaproteobacteria bacterium]
MSLRNHCLRLYELTLALDHLDGPTLDADVVYAGAMLHDVGLFVRDPGQPNYLRRGAALVGPLLPHWGLDGDAARDVREILLYNHALRPMADLGRTAELFRRAVQVEHSWGRLRHGLSKARCRDVFAQYPRLRLNRVLAGFFKTTLVDDGMAQLVPIFFPRFEAR